MERDSIIYKLRRKSQIVAHKIFPNELMSKFYYRIVLHKKLDLREPKKFNEKLQWYKLNYFPNNPLVVACTDKCQVRNYVEKKELGKYLTTLIGLWDDAKEIVWDELPKQFVLKCYVYVLYFF